LCIGCIEQINILGNLTYIYMNIAYSSYLNENLPIYFSITILDIFGLATNVVSNISFKLLITNN